MKNRILWATAVAVLVTQGLICAAERAVILRLATGAEISGVIPADGFDEARGITLQRDDNGGILRLRWDQIRDEDVVEIKRMYGFEGDDLPPIQIQALEVRTATGTVVRIDEGREDGFLLLRKKDDVMRVPLDSVRSLKNVLVDALTLEHPEAVFEQKKREADLGRPVDWYNLGLVAESLALFEQARTCFNTVLELDPNFSRATVIDRKVELLEVKEREVEQTQALQTIRSLKYRGAYREALAVCEEFEENYPDSMQLQDVMKEKASIGQAQWSSFQAAIRTDFFSYLRTQAEEMARDREVILGEAMNWAKQQAYLDVQEKLATRYGITPDKVDELWDGRGQTGSPREYSYGGGTFILDKKAKEGFDKKKPGAKDEQEEEQQEDKPKTLQEKIQEKIKERQNAQATKKKEKQVVGEIVDVPPTPEEWWQTALPKDRTAFLVAFFAEESGKVEVITLRQRACSFCSGKGYMAVFASANSQGGGGEGDIPCPRCKTLTFDRIVVFR